VIDFSTKPLELAFYAMIAANQCRLDSQPIVMSNNDPANLWLADQLLQQLELIAALSPEDHSDALLEGDKSSFMREFRERATRLTESDVLLRGAGEQTIARTYLELNYGMSSKFLNDKKNSLKKFLLEHFPADIVAYIAPAQVYLKGEWPKRRVFDGTGQQGTPLGLWIKNEKITFR